MDKKTKKKIVLARNKKNQRIFQHARDQKAEHERILDEEAALRNPDDKDNKTRKQKEQDDESWTEKTQDIRNRLNRKKRRAKDRWNRFAGTSGGGGMGR